MRQSSNWAGNGCSGAKRYLNRSEVVLAQSFLVNGPDGILLLIYFSQKTGKYSAIILAAIELIQISAFDVLFAPVDVWESQ